MTTFPEYNIGGSSTQDTPRVFTGEHLTAIDVPLGGVGGSVIRMDGTAQRRWWHIFNNFEERKDTGWVPNSFFAVRATATGKPIVRALQTESAGPFTAMDSLSFRSEYPFALYDFEDKSLPVTVSLEA